MDQKYLNSFKEFLDDVWYDYFMAQPAWIGHMHAYEFCDTLFQKMLFLAELFDREKFKHFLELRNELMKEIEISDKAIDDAADTAMACDFYHDLERLDQQYWNVFEDLFNFVFSLYKEMGGETE